LTSRTVENREVDDELYQLRVVEGRTWHDIGSRVGMSHEGARKRFHRNLGRGITDDDREQYRAEETEKLDQIEATYLEIARVALTGDGTQEGPDVLGYVPSTVSCDPGDK
jgi:hypothetical protein